MVIAIFLALTLLFSRLEAGPISSGAPANERPCVEFILPVPATAQNAEYDVVHVDDNINATAYAVDLDTWSFNVTDRLLRNITVSDTFNISVQLCVPPNGSKNQNLFIATHGGLFDKRYWDPAINPSEYSFVDAALARGYSILTYDRLGTGLSDKLDAYTIVQAPLQLEILRSITNMARSGELLRHTAGNANAASTNIFKGSNVSFEKIIHIGHSFGSVLTSAFLATYGNLSDAAVLTGYILNEHFAEMRKATFGLEYAPQNNKTLFGDRPSGYLVDGTLGGFQTIFFSTQADATTGIGGFDAEVLDYAFSIRQTITTSEFLPPPLNLGAAPEFKGPLQFNLAEFDYPVCRGNCNLPFDLDFFKSLYPNATDIDIYTQKGNGHALTMHRKANIGYKATLDWLDGNGL
ncbi:MAG: hypothetical protein LQ351_004015 [Letrouitia transgressa]|nr:MAG: hypothetical protein LQ351_004015 [Letrouitia transgressa]